MNLLKEQGYNSYYIEDMLESFRGMSAAVLKFRGTAE